MTTKKERLLVKVGSVMIGGGKGVVVQSMTDTDTADIDKTIMQCKDLSDAGSELVRITVNNEAAAKAVPEIRRGLDSIGYNLPLVGDFHYNGHTLLRKYPKCAESLAKYRINPGNVGFGKKKDEQFSEIVKFAIEYDKPIRIGVNWGSLDKEVVSRMMEKNAKRLNPLSSQAVMHESLVTSALESAQAAIQQGLSENKIIVSCKVSTVQDLISVYELLEKKCNYPLHLGLTEAGMGMKGIISSSIALGVLLNKGIGDTIRVSLTPEPDSPRKNEVLVGQQILQSLGIKSFYPSIISCPGCGRTTSTYFRTLTQEITNFVKNNMVHWRIKHPGVESMTIAVMGCIVNGPGESKYANIGISLPGTGEAPSAPVFIDGIKKCTLRGENLLEEIKSIIEGYVIENYKSRF